MKVIDSERTIEGAHAPGAPPIDAQQLSFERAGEASVDQTDSPADNKAVPTQLTHSERQRATRMTPKSRGTASMRRWATSSAPVLGDLRLDKTITEDRYKRELEDLDVQLRMAQLSTTIELDEVAELLENLAALWGAAKADERRRLLRTLVEAVHVDIESKCIVGIAPVPAFRKLIESGIERTAGHPRSLSTTTKLGIAKVSRWWRRGRPQFRIRASASSWTSRSVRRRWSVARSSNVTPSLRQRR